AALIASRAVIASHPGNARAHLASGIALRLLGRPDEALAAFGEAARRDPRDAAVPYESGLVHQALGDDDAALAAFERALRLRADFFPAHFAAGTVRLARGAFSQAADSFRAALALRPGEANTLVHLARALRGSGDLDAARVHFEGALRADPG